MMMPLSPALGDIEPVVKPGDTLAKLAARYLNNAWYGPRLWAYNPEVHNPYKLEPGTTIRFSAPENLPEEESLENRKTEIKKTGGPKRVALIGFQDTKDFSRVYVKTSEPARYEINGIGSDLVTVILYNTTSPHDYNKQTLDTHFFSSPVKKIQPMELLGTNTVVVEIHCTHGTSLRSGQAGNIVFVEFKREATGRK
jgi:hypothetical protein